MKKCLGFGGRKFKEWAKSQHKSIALMRAPRAIIWTFKKESREWTEIRGNCQVRSRLKWKSALFKNRSVLFRLTFELPLWWTVMLIFVFRWGANLFSLLSLFDYLLHLWVNRLPDALKVIISRPDSKLPSASQKWILLLQSPTSNFTILHLMSFL